MADGSGFGGGSQTSVRPLPKMSVPCGKTVPYLRSIERKYDRTEMLSNCHSEPREAGVSVMSAAEARRAAEAEHQIAVPRPRAANSAPGRGGPFTAGRGSIGGTKHDSGLPPNGGPPRTGRTVREAGLGAQGTERHVQEFEVRELRMTRVRAVEAVERRRPHGSGSRACGPVFGAAAGPEPGTHIPAVLTPAGHISASSVPGSSVPASDVPAGSVPAHRRACRPYLGPSYVGASHVGGAGVGDAWFGRRGSSRACAWPGRCRRVPAPSRPAPGPIAVRRPIPAPYG